MSYELANNAITLYTNVTPNVFFSTINKVFGEELYECMPLLFPLANLIDLGCTNYNDVSCSKYQMERRVHNLNTSIYIHKSYKSTYNEKTNLIELRRGAVISYEDLK